MNVTIPLGTNTGFLVRLWLKFSMEPVSVENNAACPPDIPHPTLLISDSKFAIFNNIPLNF
jgi:hypothetical protein